MSRLSTLAFLVAAMGAAATASPAGDQVELRGALESAWQQPVEGARRLHGRLAATETSLTTLLVQTKKQAAALDLSGELRWRTRAHRSVEAVEVLDDLLILRAGKFGVEAIDLETGKVRWAHQSISRIWRSTQHAGQWIFLNAEHQIGALSLEDGSLSWKTALAERKRGRARLAYLVPLPESEDILLVEAARLSRLGARDGERSWSIHLPAAGRAGAYVSAERVILPAGRSLVAYRLEDGQCVWGHDLGASSYYVTISEEAGVAVAATRADRLVGIDLHTGERLWEARLSVGHRRVVPGPERIKEGDLVYIEAARAQVRQRRGWKQIDGPPLLTSGGMVYCVSSGYAILAYDLRNGRQRWRLPLRSSATGLHLMGGALCTGSFRQPAVCVDAASGKMIWSNSFGPAQIRQLEPGLLLAWNGWRIRLVEVMSSRILAEAMLSREARDLLALPQEGLLVAALPDLVLALRWERP